LTALLVISVLPAGAQEMAVPLETQLSLLPKILSFEKNITTRFGPELTIGIVYQRNFRASSTVKENIFTLQNDFVIDRVGTLPVNYIPIEFSNIVNFFIDVSKLKPDILYIAPLRSVSISKISEVAQKLDIISFTGIPEYVEEGIGLGIGTKNGKPLIIINLPSVKEEGLTFSSRLLTISKIIE
jgi:hypothetical protein